MTGDNFNNLILMRWTVQKVCEYKIPNVYLVLFYNKNEFVILHLSFIKSRFLNYNQHKFTKTLQSPIHFLQQHNKKQNYLNFLQQILHNKTDITRWRKRWETSIIKSQYLLIYNTKSIIPFNLLLYFHILLYILPPSLSIICKILYNI